jgi:magnesium transporter
LSGLIGGDVLAEMNEWVRDELIDALEPHQVARDRGRDGDGRRRRHH